MINIKKTIQLLATIILMSFGVCLLFSMYYSDGYIHINSINEGWAEAIWTFVIGLIAFIINITSVDVA